MGWEKGLISVGGDTQGQVFKYLPYKFTQAPDIGHNSYELMVYTEERPLTAYGNDFSWSPDTQITNHTYLMFPIYDANDTLIRYLTIKYGYRAYDDGGRKRLIIDMDVGYTDLNQTYTHQYGISCANSVVSSSYLFKAKIHICFGKYNNDDLFGIAIQIEDTLNQDYQCEGVIITRDWLQGLAPEDVEHSPEFGDASEPKGGYGEDSERKGTFDNSSDKITYSSKPTMHAGMTGFFHAYFVTQSQLQHIGKAMFPQAQSSYTDLIDAMAGVVTSIWNSKKIDCLVDCLVLPISVPFGTETNIQCGGGDLIYFDGATWQNIKGNPVTDYYVDVNCGTLELEEYWCNYLDYSGTRIKIFLPYIGFVNLQPEYINGGSVNVKYRFNVIDGSFMCVLHSTSGKSNLDESLIGQYSGMACLHIPITSQNYSQQISGLISSSGMAVTAGLTGNAGMAFGSAMNLANTLAQKPSTSHNNGYNSSSSFLSHRKPYIIIERQVAQFSTQYPEENGLPSYVSKPLSQIHGFTILDNPVLNIDCNADEYNEIISLLKTGVIF